ncbi:MAG: undecaprenyl-phosphate glucose phosphotransferase [Polyangiales bacterium]
MGKRRGILQQHEPTLSVIQRIADSLCIALGLVVAFEVYPDAGPWAVRHTLAMLVAVIAFTFIGEANGLYQTWRGIPLKHEAQRIWMSWFASIPVLLVFAFFTKSSEEYSRAVALLWFAAAPVFLSLFRFGLRMVAHELRRRGRNTRTVAIVGATESGELLARRILEMPWLGMRIEGFYDDRAQDRLARISEELGTLRGTMDEVVERARRGELDIVYIALPLKAEGRINDLLTKLKDTTASVHMIADFFVFDLLRGRWSSLGDMPVVSLHDTPFFGIDGWLKRAEDVVLGSLFLTIASVPMAFVALGVKLTSRGPVLFRQRRYGLNGEVIEVLKFRSMTVAEDGAKVTQATKNDARVTPFGAFLRRTSLDELPQLMHVVTGKMSLVGPRPHAIAHNELYRKKIQGYMLRHKVKPGLTGWAQVNGWRGETDTLEKMEKRIEHDLDYIRNWGLLLDIKIVIMTILGSASRNAY